MEPLWKLLGVTQGLTAVIGSGGKTSLLYELAEELRSEPLPLVIVGDGAVLCEKALTESGLPCRLAPPQLVMQNAMSVALCAEDLARAGKLVSAQELLPVYLRPPQAQRLRQPPQI